MVTFKYVLIVLRADNQGEGGTFSCYSLLTRYVSPYNSSQLQNLGTIPKYILKRVSLGEFDRPGSSRSRFS